MTNILNCEHLPSKFTFQIHELWNAFPSQGDFSYQRKCTKCGCWLICKCDREFFFKLLPNYIEKLQKSVCGVDFYVDVCDVCTKGDSEFKQRRERIRRAIEYIYQNDKDFFNYCYGIPISGYEKDMNIRYPLRNHNSPSKELENDKAQAKLRQEKARQLLNDYFFRTKDS